MGRAATWLLAHGDEPVDHPSAASFQQLIERRAAGEPFAYIVGRQGFHRLELAVDARVLIPRADTELLVDVAICEYAARPNAGPLRLLDLCTGSGAVALALAAALPQADIVATDLSAAALDCAKANARALLLERVVFYHGDLFEPVVGQRFDLIVANPPYLAEDDPHLVRGDLRHEPRCALVGGRTGLEVLDAIIAAAAAHLHEGGWLAVEHGQHQGAVLRKSFVAAGFTAVTTYRDLEQRERVTAGRQPGATRG